MSELRRITEDYHLDKLLHSSEAANVFRATRLPSGDIVAVKLISATDESQREAFEELAGALRALNHPGLPRFLDFGFTTAGTAFLVTEFCAGSQLPPLAIAPPDRALSILLQLAEVLEAFTGFGTHHGRLEAENVLLLADAPDGENVKLLGLRCATTLPQGQGVAIDRRDLARLSCQLLGVALDETSAELHVTLPQTLAGREGAGALCSWIESALRPSGSAPQAASDVFRAALATGGTGSARMEAERTLLLPAGTRPDRPRTVAASATDPARSSGPESVLLPFPGATIGEEDRTMRIADVKAIPTTASALAAAPAPVPQEQQPGPPETPAPEVSPPPPPTPVHPAPGARSVELEMPATIVTPVASLSAAAAAPSTPPVPPTPQSGSAPPPPVTPAAPIHHAGPAPASPVQAAERSGSHSKVLLGGVIVLMLALAAGAALVVRRTASDEPATPPVPPAAAKVVAPPAHPPAAAAAPVPAPPPTVNPQIEQAEADLGNGKLADARKDLAAITPEQQAAFSEPERDRYQQVKAALDTTTGEEVTKALSTGLATGNLTQLNGALAASKGMTGLRPDVQADLSKARRAVSLASRLRSEEKAGDLGEAIKSAIALQQVLPAFTESTVARDRAASTLLSRADTAIEAAQYDTAQGILDTLRTSWPEAPQIADRQARLTGLRQNDAKLDAALASAVRFEKANQPTQGLQQLNKEKPTGPFVERFRVERDRLKDLLAKLDAAPPEVALAPGVKLEYEKDKPAEIKLKVTDDYQVKGVEAWARAQGGAYQKVSVQHDSGADYLIEVPVSLHDNKQIEFYVTASDQSGHQGSLGTAQDPIKVKRRNWFQKLIGNGA